MVKDAQQHLMNVRLTEVQWDALIAFAAASAKQLQLDGQFGAAAGVTSFVGELEHVRRRCAL